MSIVLLIYFLYIDAHQPFLLRESAIVTHPHFPWLVVMIWLPTEILEEILCNLDYYTLKQCCLVNRDWYHVIISLNSVWFEMCHQNSITLSGSETLRHGCQVTSPGHVTSPQHVLNSAEFYHKKIRLMAMRCKEFNMKGYSFDEEVEPLDVDWCLVTASTL